MIIIIHLYSAKYHLICSNAQIVQNIYISKKIKLDTDYCESGRKK